MRLSDLIQKHAGFQWECRIGFLLLGFLRDVKDTWRALGKQMLKAWWLVKVSRACHFAVFILAENSRSISTAIFLVATANFLGNFCGTSPIPSAIFGNTVFIGVL